MTTATQTLTKPGTYAVDPVHSRVEFAVRYMGVSTFRSGFDRFDARLTVGEDGAEHLTGSAQVETIRLEDEQQKGHVLSPDFFDVERHPEIKFESSEIEQTGDGDEAVFHGTVTINGESRPIQAKGTRTYIAEDPFGNERYGIELEAKVDRREFGLDWNQALPKGGFMLGNEVRITADLQLIKEDS